MANLSLIQKLIFVIPTLLIAFVVHEMAHGYAAYLFGDPTPKYEGRLSPDPVKHIDPFGALLIIILIFSNSPFVFGWAKPVQVNPNNFRRPRQDMAWVALAGPLSNFTMAAVAGALIRFNLVTTIPALFNFVYMFVLINIGLGVFNLIPFPPLDGSKIIYGILPADWAYKLMGLEMRYAQFVPFVLIILLLSRVLDPIIGVPYVFLYHVFTGL